ncbi:MAG: pyridoxal phosphate-dependent aminotransferase, partial [bacterium]|nr:pyridoxal phosphate-dependent aminotransferase [bacterium]
TVAVVSGLPRSGTSLLMQMLRAAGLSVLADGSRMPDPNNRFGYFEHRRVRSLATSPDSRAWLEKCGPGRAVKVVSALLPHLPQASGLHYRVLLAEREPAAVAASQDAMLARLGEERGALDPRRLAEVLAAQQAEARALLEQRDDCRWFAVSFESLLAAPAAMAARIADFLEGGRDALAMESVVRPGRGGFVGGYTPAMADPRFDDLDTEVLRRRSGEKWQTYADDVLPLWVADMDFDVAEPIRQRLQECLDIGDLGYPLHPAPTGLPEVFAERAARRWGWQVEPGQIELLTEVVQAMYVTLEQFSGPGDGVIVQTPIYPPFTGVVKELGRRLEENPLTLGESGYAVDLEGLAACAARSKLLLLCNPHNPSGRVFRREELQGIAEIADAHDLVVVSDEIHSDLVYPGCTHIPFATLSDSAASRTITLTAASKAFNIAGLRCALAVFGSDELRKRFLAFPRHFRGGLGSLGIQATLTAWREGDPWLRDLLVYLEGNRDFIADTLRQELPDVRFFRPEATYLAWLDFRAMNLSPSPYRHFLENGKLALSDGRAFGPPGQGFARINFATSRPILTTALERLIDSLR